MATAGHGSLVSSSTGRNVTLTFSRSSGSDRRQSALRGSLEVHSQDEQPLCAGGEEACGESLKDTNSQVTERRDPFGLTNPTHASRTRQTPAQFQNPFREASLNRVDASQQAEASREAELPFPNIQSLQGSPATSQPQYSQFVTTPDGTQPSAYTVQAQPATQESSQPNFEDDIDVLEAQVQILEQVHSCLTKYGPQMPKVAHSYRAREWFMQHSSNADKIRFVDACLKRDAAESSYIERMVQKDKAEKVVAVNMLQRNPVQRMPTEEMVHNINAYEMMADADAIEELQKANTHWEKECTVVAAKCLSWINSLQHSLAKE